MCGGGSNDAGGAPQLTEFRMPPVEQPDAEQKQMNCYLDARKAHTCCMVCSSRDNNPDTVNLMFSEHPDGSVCADYTANHRHQGYTGLLHGGMTGTLLDAAMTHCLFMQGVQALTAELTVRFISPVCTGDKLMVCARLLGQRRGFTCLKHG